jgi:dethiobiotin synthetase
MPMIIQNYFVTGTDTEVGKTLVTALLARFLKDVCELNDDLEISNPVRWEEPLAPLIAARRAPRSEDYWARALKCYEGLAARHATILVEGVGGVLVPIAERDGEILTCLDLMKVLALPVVVVARRTLGTINHTVLTIETLRNANLEIAGVLFCDALLIEEDNIAALTSTSLIAEMTGVKILGVVPHLENLSREMLRAAAQKYLDFD